MAHHFVDLDDRALERHVERRWAQACAQQVRQEVAARWPVITVFNWDRVVAYRQTRLRALHAQPPA